jgi:hypothetical protein
MERLDQSFLHPLVKYPRQTYTRRWACTGCGGGRLLRREPEDRRYPEGVPASRSHANARGGSSLEGRHPAMSDEAFILEKKHFIGLCQENFYVTRSFWKN